MSTCELILTRIDDRSPERTQAQYSFSREATVAHKEASSAHNVVCKFFGIEENWDQKLVQSFLHEDTDTFDRFFANRQDYPICYAVLVQGDKQILTRLLEKYEPIQKEESLSLTIRKLSNKGGFSVKVDGEFSYDEIKLGDFFDNTAVALFNSKSFKNIREYNRSFSYKRVFEKLEPEKSKL
ncbi:MAG TPA: hypothetical protein VLG49_01755 [Rhabdochlamydiaceae bacterium]|nr:hypothetical protein [Rhabdochlamydiaceae bacterium]